MNLDLGIIRKVYGKVMELYTNFELKHMNILSTPLPSSAERHSSAAAGAG